MKVCGQQQKNKLRRYVAKVTTKGDDKHMSRELVQNQAYTEDCKNLAKPSRSPRWQILDELASGGDDVTLTPAETIYTEYQENEEALSLSCNVNDIQNSKTRCGIGGAVAIITSTTPTVTTTTTHKLA